MINIECVLPKWNDLFDVNFYCEIGKQQQNYRKQLKLIGGKNWVLEQLSVLIQKTHVHNAIFI